MPFNQFTRPIYLKNTRIDRVSNKILERHAEKVNKKEKLHITFVVTILIQMSQSGTDYIQGAPYVFERFSEAVLRSWVDIEIKCYHIFLTQVYTFQMP